MEDGEGNRRWGGEGEGRRREARRCDMETTRYDVMITPTD